jgi:RNA polymerase sigma-70 factor (ECF subfamily)
VSDPDVPQNILEKARAGSPEAIAQLFELHRDRLRRMVQVRLDRRLQGRVDPSDVLQETYLDLSRRAQEYFTQPAIPFFLWLRLLTGQRLLALHRHHLGAKMRDASQEIAFQNGAMPEATSEALAAQFLSHLTTPSQAVVRAEMQHRLQEILNSMEPLDREVLMLRHFEELTNQETADVLGLQKAAASNRYVRALKRLRGILTQMPDFLEAGQEGRPP